ncbi:MAG: conjugal transfer protein TraF [Rickettsiaceae bacterium]|nr:conjugal transfer protein TraF [Rickettsiaceae bacterium]
MNESLDFLSLKIEPLSSLKKHFRIAKYARVFKFDSDSIILPLKTQLFIRLGYRLGLLLFSLLFMVKVVDASNKNINKKRDFYQQRYRGWLWFEDKEKKLAKQQKELIISKKVKEELAGVQARKDIEQFKEELARLKYMMLRYPNNINHVLRYKQKEAIMLNNALLLAETTRMVNFLNPNLNDELANPLNLYGRRIKQEIDTAKQKQILIKLAKEVELFLFFSNRCPYCMTLNKHLAFFAKKYNFKVEAISLDGSINKYFKTYHDKALAKALKLEVMPTVIAVTKDSKIRFELARGAVSISDLEEKSLLLAKKLELEKIISEKN